MSNKPGPVQIGVTALGRANYAQPAYYTEAFFALSIGLERSAKIALLVDHALDHDGNFPSNKLLRGYGHDLGKLLDRADGVAERRAPSSGQSDRLPTSDIHQGIITVLTDFATNLTRYYNLDIATGDSQAKQRTAPLHAWQKLVVKPVMARHYTSSRAEKDHRNAEMMEKLIGSDTLVRHRTESGEELDSVFDASLLTGVTEFIRPYCRMYVMQICRFVSHLMSDLTFAAYEQKLEEVPHLTDFYVIFNNSDRYFRSRKTWSIYRL